MSRRNSSCGSIFIGVGLLTVGKAVYVRAIGSSVDSRFGASEVVDGVFDGDDSFDTIGCFVSEGATGKYE
jgi:hypothetical protein